MFIDALIVSVVALWFQTVSSIEFSGVDDADFQFLKDNGGFNSTLTGTNTYASAVNYGKTHPTRDGGSWNGW